MLKTIHKNGIFDNKIFINFMETAETNLLKSIYRKSQIQNDLPL